MSDAEKAAQIGNAVTEYQNAKTDLAHHEKKIETIFRNYMEVGACMDRSRGTIDPPRVKDGKLDLGWRGSKIDPSLLLNASELTKVVQERDEAQERFDRARRGLNDLGITGLS